MLPVGDVAATLPAAPPTAAPTGPPTTAPATAPVAVFCSVVWPQAASPAERAGRARAIVSILRMIQPPDDNNVAPQRGHARSRFRNWASWCGGLRRCTSIGSKRYTLVAYRHNPMLQCGICLPSRRGFVHTPFTICRRLPPPSPGRACRRSLPARAGAIAATTVGGRSRPRRVGHDCFDIRNAGPRRMARAVERRFDRFRHRPGPGRHLHGRRAWRRPPPTTAGRRASRRRPRGGFSETMLQREIERMDPAALRLARAHDDRRRRRRRRRRGRPRAATTAASGRRGSALDRARELDCLTQAVYFEARGETPRGQAAVAQVVLNRVQAPGLPEDRLRRGLPGRGQPRLPVQLRLRRLHAPRPRARRLGPRPPDRRARALRRGAGRRRRGDPLPHHRRLAGLGPAHAARRPGRPARLLPLQSARAARADGRAAARGVRQPAGPGPGADRAAADRHGHGREDHRRDALGAGARARAAAAAPPPAKSPSPPTRRPPAPATPCRRRRRSGRIEGVGHRRVLGAAGEPRR